MITKRTLVILLGALAVVGAGQPDKASIVTGASGGGDDNLRVHAGGLVLIEGTPGVGYGTVAKFGGQRELTYVIVFKHDFKAVSQSQCGGESSSDGSKGKAKQVIDLDDRKFTIVYQIEIDTKNKTVQSESLTINDKNVDVAKGRVFLVDLTVQPPKWEQKKLDLPAELDDDASTTGAKKIAAKALDKLGKQDKKVRAFIKEASR
jgi:hypothetical protein